MDFYRFCIILKFIDISKNILVQNPDKGPLRFTPLDSTQHCTGTGGTLDTNLGSPPDVRMLDGYNPVFPPRPAPVCCRPELCLSAATSQAAPLATMLTLDTDQRHEAHTQHSTHSIETTENYCFPGPQSEAFLGPSLIIFGTNYTKASRNASVPIYVKLAGYQYIFNASFPLSVDT